MSTRKQQQIMPLIVSFVLLTTAPTFAGNIIYVDDDAAPSGDGKSWETAFTYLQDALMVASSGDEIRVAQGIYKPDQGAGITPGDRMVSFRWFNGVTVRGGYTGFGESDPNAHDVQLYETILSGDLFGNDIDVNDPCDLLDHPSRGENSYHVVGYSGGGAILDGFTITGGNANGYGFGNRDNGGGVISGPTVMRNCTIARNSARDGGGISGPGVLVNCTFTNNFAETYGGAMWQGGSVLTDCNFSGNSAGWRGGAAAAFDTSGTGVTFINCVFERNSAEHGGGIGNYEARATLINCTFSRNSAENDGGGISNCCGSSSTLVRCTFSGNSANVSGGAVSNEFSKLTMANCAFTGNETGGDGGAMHHKAFDEWASVTLTNCTFAGNSAATGKALAYAREYIDDRSRVRFANCILWNDGEEIWNPEGSGITIAYSDVRGGQAGVYDPCGTVIWDEGNIDIDPCFANSGYWDPNGTEEDPNDDFWVDGDYHLLPGSPCINAGDPNYVVEPNETDLDGNPRIINGRIDIGAYEYNPPLPAEVDIDPDTLNLNSKGRWITAFIWLPENYNIADIDPNSILIEEQIKAELLSVNEQEQVALAKFSREEVQQILELGQVELTITGRLMDGTVFEGTDMIKVINKAGK